MKTKNEAALRRMIDTLRVGNTDVDREELADMLEWAWQEGAERAAEDLAGKLTKAVFEAKLDAQDLLLVVRRGNSQKADDPEYVRGKVDALLDVEDMIDELAAFRG